MTRAPLPGRGRSASLLAAAAFVAVLAAPTAVLGHAELDTMTPANGSTVTAAPTEIVATFTEPLDPSKSSIVVLNGSGAQVASGGQVDAADTKKMTLALPPLEAGTYQVRWTTASALDGDLDRGTTGFAYAPAPSPSASPSAASSATPAASAAATPSPSIVASVAPSPSGSGQPAGTSTSDLLIPIVVAVILVAGLGYWLLRGRSRSGGTP
jgi:methionine-rich copper-binding protein CopC